MGKHIATVGLCLMLGLLLFGWSVPIGSAAPEKATVTFTFDSQSSQLSVTIDSPVGVSGGDIKLDIPIDIDIGIYQSSGFMTGAMYWPEAGTTHRWFQMFASGEKQGSLSVSITLPDEATPTVTLLEVNLLDAADNVIPIETPLPWDLEVAAGAGPGTEPGLGPTPGGFAVLSPNGGEILEGRTTFPITWTVLEGEAWVDLFYSWDGGIKWRQIARRRDNTGTYHWRVPNQDIESCLIKLDACDAAGERITDTSDAPFTVQRSEHGAVIGCE